MNAIKNASIKQWFRKNLKKYLSNISTCFDKRYTYLLSFIIVFYCSTVAIGKNTKNSKKYGSLEEAIPKCMEKNLGDHVHLVF